MGWINLIIAIFAVVTALNTKTPKLSMDERESRVKNVLNPDYHVPVIYGEGRTDGNLIFYNTANDAEEDEINNDFLDVVVVVAEGEIDGFTKIFMDDGEYPIFDASEYSRTTLEAGVELESTHPLYGETVARTTLRVDLDKLSESTFYYGNHLKATGNTIQEVADNLSAAASAWVTVTVRDNTDDVLSIRALVTGKRENGQSVRQQWYETSTDDYGTYSNRKKLVANMKGGRETIHAYGTFYNGTEDQTANATLVDSYAPTATSDGWTTDHKLDGFAYIYIRLRHNADLFGGGIPKFSCELRGKKVLDTRTSITAYSENTAMCLRDYLLSGRYGKALEVSDIDEATFITAANDCDTVRDGKNVAGDPITYTAYTIGAVVDTSKKVKDNVGHFLQAMNGALPYFNGIYSLTVMKAGNATVTLDKTNIIGKVSLTSSSKRDRMNKSLMTFPDKNRHYAKGDAVIDPVTPGTSSYSAEAAAFLVIDNDQLLETRTELPYVNYYPQARDAAELAMNLSRIGLVINLTTTLEILDNVVGDITAVTYEPFGWTGKEFRIEQIISRLDGMCDVSLSEHSDALYDLVDKQELPEPNVTSLQTTSEVMEPVITSVLSDASTALVSTDGIVSPRILVQWDNYDAYPLEHKIYAKKSDEDLFVRAGQVTAGDDLTFYINNIDWDTSYDVAVTTVNTLGYESIKVVRSLAIANPLALATYNYPDVIGLELIGAGTDLGAGLSDEFTGQDIRLQWRLSSENVEFEWGSDVSESLGGVGGVVPLTLTGYRVEVFHSGDTEPRQEYTVTDPNFTYTYDKNFEDGDGSAARDVSFKVYAFGSVTNAGVSGESDIPATISVSNPQPELPTNLSISARYQVITVDFDVPVDNDYAGILVWASESTSFTPDASTLVYDGSDSSITIDGLEKDTPYFIIVAPYDGFGIAGINYSSEYSVTTLNTIDNDDLSGLSNWALETDPVDLTFITDNMADDAISSTQIEGVVAGKIQAGTIASVVNISGVFTAVGGGTPEAVFNKTLSVGDWRMDMGPVADTGATYLLRYYNGYDDAHGSYEEAFSIDDSGSAKFSGAVQASSFITATTGKRMEINPSDDNEMHFYGDQGDTNITELATIGIRSYGGDNTIGFFGNYQLTYTAVAALSGTGTGLFARSEGTAILALSVDGSPIETESTNGIAGRFESQTSFGMAGFSTDSYGSYAYSGLDVGGFFGCGSGGKGPIYLLPSTSSSAPVHSADKGTLWVTSTAVLYINTNGSTTWGKVGAQ